MPNGCKWSALLMLRLVSSGGAGGERKRPPRPGVALMFVLKPHQGSYLSSRQSEDAVKAEMVDYAREKWPMLFSRFYEVTKLSGR